MNVPFVALGAGARRPVRVVRRRPGRRRGLRHRVLTQAGVGLLALLGVALAGAAGWLSLWSSESHAAERLPAGGAASHSASSVVFPKPAGAETSVSFDSAPWFKRSVSRGRGTRPRRRLGT